MEQGERPALAAFRLRATDFDLGFGVVFYLVLSEQVGSCVFWHSLDWPICGTLFGYSQAMGRRLIVLGLLFLSIVSYGQSEYADSVMTTVLNALTTEQRKLSEPADSLLELGAWEALAYWDTRDDKSVESLHEAVGDRYAFSDGRFVIQLIDPNNPRQLGMKVEGFYERVRYRVEFHKTADSGPIMAFEIWYLDKNYMVIQMDELRIFLTHEQSYYLMD